MTRSTMKTKQPWFAAVAAAALSSVALYAQPADACDCALPPGPAQALASADAVFEARAQGSTTPPGQPIADAFTVLRAWKGAPGSGPLTMTSGSSSSCGYDFVAGETYLVYAYRDSKGSLTTSICSRTRRSADAADDFAALGAPGGSGSSAPPGKAPSSSAPGTTGAPPSNPPGGNTTGAPPSPAEPPPSGGAAGLNGAPAPQGDPPSADPPPSGGGCAACAIPSGAFDLDGNAHGFAALLGLAALARRIAGRRR